MNNSAVIPMGSICRGCEYDLTGLSAPGVCPECGREFAELASDERIELEWPCLRCGYSLLGLRQSQKCSECGMPAIISLDSTLFRFQPAEYRKRVKRGALFAGLGVASMLLLPLVIAVLLLVWGTSSAIALRDTAIGTTLGWVLATGIFVFGWLRLLTAPPATMGLNDRQESIRVWARRLLVLYLILVFATTLTNLLLGPAAGGIGPASVVASASMILWIVSFGAFLVMSLLALRPLFARARTVSKRPGGIAHFTLWLGVLVVLGYLVPFGLGTVTSVMGSGANQVLSGPLMVVVSLSAILAFVGSAVLFFTYIGTTESLRGALKRVEREIAAAHRNALPPTDTETGETPGMADPNNQSS